MFNLISPKIGLSMIKRHYSKELNKKITSFEMVFDKSLDTLYMYLNGEKYIYDSDTFKEIIKYRFDEISKDIEGEIKFIKILDENPPKLTVYYLDKNGEKKFFKQNL